MVISTRFKTSKQIVVYCGCDPSLKVSAGKVTSHSCRKDNETLHTSLIKAASILIQRRSEPIGKWGYNLYKCNSKDGWKKHAELLLEDW